MGLKDRVIEFRVEHGLSQQKFADRAGLSRSLIAKLESGKCVAPKSKSIQQIEYALNGGEVYQLDDVSSWTIMFFADGKNYVCKKCHSRHAEKSKYCPECGRRMQ